MKLNRIATGVLFCAVIALSGPIPAFAQASADKPNILWITVEDISPFIGSYGNREVKTPNIDRLAREGLRYSRTYTVSGVCAPSRASLITGMYPTAVGAQHMRTGAGGELSKAPAALQKMAAAFLPAAGPDAPPTYAAVLPAEVKAFPEYLRKAGYYTTNNEKTDYQFIAPVTVWDENGPAASYRNRPQGKPFFSVFNFFITHESMIGLHRKDPLLEEPGKVSVPPIYPDIPVVRTDIARLYTNIEIMDRQVGELIDQLKRDGLYDKTIIFFFSDNGGNLPWMKREITERGTHIPFIVRFPGGRNGGKINDDLISGVDFAPTVLSLAGVPIPSYMQGQAFLGQQAAKTPRRYVFGARDRMDTEYDRVRMVRDKQFRYLFNYMPEKPYYQDLAYRKKAIPMMNEILALRDKGELPPIPASWFKTKPFEELYDVERDPWESNNLAGDPRYQDKLLELRAALQEWTSQYGDLGGLPEREMVRRMWNGGDHPPATAAPEIVPVKGGVRLTCATPGASVGYWIERTAQPARPESHIVHSWDYSILYGDILSIPGVKFPKNGDHQPTPPTWTVYDGEVIALHQGDVLHINAQRIGYEAAVIDYAGGKVIGETKAKAP
jgi:arylsulfatase A-like enzyme